MIKTLEHWFVMNVVPEELRGLIERMSKLLGYKTMRKDENGMSYVSSMYLMQCKAAEVSFGFFFMASDAYIFDTLHSCIHV